MKMHLMHHASEPAQRAGKCTNTNQTQRWMQKDYAPPNPKATSERGIPGDDFEGRGLDVPKTIKRRRKAGGQTVGMEKRLVEQNL